MTYSEIEANLSIMTGLITGDTERAETFNDYLNPEFIEPLKKLGFKLESYGCQGDSEVGCHVLVFKEEYPFTLADVKDIQEVMKDDDSQPYSQFRYYMGTLWVFIPFFA